MISVSDTGIGIAAEALPRVFDMFVQANARDSRAQSGLGIGLTLVRSLVEMHGGSVAARSAGAGLGSEFLVRLPLARHDARLALLRPAPPEGQSRACRGSWWWTTTATPPTAWPRC